MNIKVTFPTYTDANGYITRIKSIEHAYDYAINQISQCADGDDFKVTSHTWANGEFDIQGFYGEGDIISCPECAEKAEAHLLYALKQLYSALASKVVTLVKEHAILDGDPVTTVFYVEDDCIKTYIPRGYNRDRNDFFQVYKNFINEFRELDSEEMKKKITELCLENFEDHRCIKMAGSNQIASF